MGSGHPYLSMSVKIVNINLAIEMGFISGSFHSSGLLMAEDCKVGRWTNFSFWSFILIDLDGSCVI